MLNQTRNIYQGLTDDEKQEIVDNTEKYINTYLVADKKWAPKINVHDKIRDLRNAWHIDWDMVARKIRSMSYSTFLETPYWKAIIVREFSEAGGRCQLCNSAAINSKLVVHHRTYDTHGYELQDTSDLIVLCDSCHRKHHGIEETEEDDYI